MTTISELYAPHHRRCDEEFASAEAAAAEGQWDKATEATTRFCAMLEAHLGSEEGTLFPAFEGATGMVGGPTAMMRMEHQQMRGLLGQLEHACAGKDADAFAGAAETMLILMQQHNMKEENILYPMCDNAVTGAEVLEAIRTQLAK
ncbi:MAG: hemerythrin domain-containing protein [Myxococcales bacterium]|nr:hemerythrin domain-containing protein [Myxococcales bacterium]